MIDRKITISNLETNIRWIEDIPCHQFPGWGNVTMSMRDALELLKEQEAMRCKNCRSNRQCSIQFKFADADDEGNWFCADFNPSSGKAVKRE